MTIILIRHGETTENHSRVVQVPTASLSETGLSQAARLAEYLATRKVSRILSSDMTRAAQTATAIAAHHDPQVEFSPLLHERNLGDLRGQSYDDIGFNFFAEDYVPPQGESWRAFHQRVEQAWQYILNVAARCQNDLVVVTHGLVCRRIAQNHLSLPEGQQVPERWDNTSFTLIDRDSPFQASVVNSTEHLKGMATTGQAGTI